MKDRSRRNSVCSFEGIYLLARWLSWLERRPVTAEVVGSNPIRVVYNRIMLYIWDLSSAGRASALQAEGHRFEPCRSHHLLNKLLIYQAGVAELADAQDLKSCGTYTPIRVRFPLPAFGLSNKYV